MGLGREGVVRRSEVVWMGYMEREGERVVSGCEVRWGMDWIGMARAVWKEMKRFAGNLGFRDCSSGEIYVVFGF